MILSLLVPEAEATAEAEATVADAGVAIDRCTLNPEPIGSTDGSVAVLPSHSCHNRNQ
jgi:hypothetical protein